MSALSDADKLVDLNRQGPPQRDRSDCCDPCKWYKEKPTKRWRFLLFFIIGCSTLVWLVMYALDHEDPNPYIFSGIICIIMCIWALNHFRILAKLTTQVDKMFRLNQVFVSENRKLRNEVVKLSKAGRRLNSVTKRIETLNAQLQQDVMKFQELDKNLRHISDTSIKGIKQIQHKSKAVADIIYQSLIRHEKSILHQVYDSLEWDNQMEGLDEQQFNQFWQKLPKSYNQRWLAMNKTFEDISGNNGVLDYKEFVNMVNGFAQQEALSGGSYSY
mmetsp:Transcript_28950/g.47401  ORF Transcript_28950/g.47401 Transcript_28950/m.47401 type:complete len:273 (+) Transcript_28950:46-864(+)